MIYTALLFIMFGVVSWPASSCIAPAIVATTGTQFPQIIDQYVALSAPQKQMLAFILATFFSYPAVYLASATVEFLFFPCSWLLLLISALALQPQTRDFVRPFLKLYIPCSLKLLPEQQEQKQSTEPLLGTAQASIMGGAKKEE